MELIKNNLYTILLKRRTETRCGILLSFGREWLLLRHNTVDYVLDGYILIRRKYIKDIIRGEHEIFRESVIRLKLTAEEFDKTYPEFDEILDALHYLLQHETVIQFDFHDDSVCYIGKIKNVYAKTVRIVNLDPKGNWEDEESTQIEKIRTIEPGFRS